MSEKSLAVPRVHLGLVEEEDSTRDASQGFAPQPVGWFSRNPDDGSYTGEERSTVKFLHEPKNLNNVLFDLREGQGEKYNISYGASIEPIEPLLHWLRDNTPEGERPGAGGFIANRRDVFASALKIPYEIQDDLSVYAIRIKNTIYLTEFPSERDLQENSKMVNNDLYLSSTKQGQKLQHFMLSDTPGEAPDTTKPFQMDAYKMTVVLRATLGEHTLLYGSKVKGVRDEETLMDIESAKLFDLRTARNLEYKSHQVMRWWADATMGKIDQLFLAIRGDRGVVGQLEVLSMPDLKRKFEEKYGQFNGGGRGRGGRGRGGRSRGNLSLNRSTVSGKDMAKKSFNFLDKLLTFLKDEVKRDGPDVVYRVHWSPKSRERFLHITELSGEESKKFRFLPEWYLEWLNARDLSKK